MRESETQTPVLEFFVIVKTIIGHFWHICNKNNESFSLEPNCETPYSVYCNCNKTFQKYLKWLKTGIILTPI